MDFNNDIIEISSLSENIDGNFGSGIELLMNDKKKEGSTNNKSSDIDIEDLTNLENELNELVDDTASLERNVFQNKSDIFNMSSSSNSGFGSSGPSVRFDDNINIGKATAQTSEEPQTWDGYGKFNNIPMNPDKAPASSQPQMSKEELLREKFKYLRKLETLESKGVTLTKKYSMESPLAEMQGEYEMIMEEKSKQNSVKFQSNMLMACINGIEFLNNRFDPFDIKLDGWSDQVSENMGDYDEVFGELHDKYKSRASMAPELKLLFQLGGSAMMVHMTNTMFKSAMPGMDDILRQNPDLMRQFQTAAVNSMGQSNPGFSGFVNGLMNPEPQPSMGSGPPPPLATQDYNNMNNSTNRPGNNNYANRTTNYNAYSTTMNDGINIKENNASTTTPERSSRFQSSRAEMKGPSDIDDILSGLKTKTINIQEAQSQNNDSTISISDLKELQSNGNMPKKAKRRQKSDRNTLSLDI